jgi:hypothetical protein
MSMRILLILCACLVGCLGTVGAKAQTATSSLCTTTAPILSGTIEVTGIAVTNACAYPVAVYVCDFVTPKTSCPLTPATIDGLVTADITLSPVLESASESVTSVAFECPAGAAAITKSTFQSSSGAPSCQAVTSGAIAASALPDAFAASIDQTATVFATMINTGSATLSNCRIGLAEPAPTELQFAFQQTNPTTNTPIGMPNTAVTIAAKGKASFVLFFGSPLPVAEPGLPLEYACDGGVTPLSTAGLSSVDVDIATGAIANIVAIAATASNSGILTVPVGAAGAFAIATDNAGSAAATVTVTADTGGAALPLTLSVCETNAHTGACLAAPSASVTVDVAQGARPTFSVFATASGTIALAPATNRVFVRFKLNGTELGETSVAVQS